MSGLLFSLFCTQERFTLYERVIRSFLEWENWKLDLQICITLFGFVFLNKREQIALFKKATRANRSLQKVQFAFFDKYQRANSQPWLELCSIFYVQGKPISNYLTLNNLVSLSLFLVKTIPQLEKGNRLQGVAITELLSSAL